MQGNILAVTSQEAERDKRSLSRLTQLARLLDVIMILEFSLGVREREFVCQGLSHLLPLTGQSLPLSTIGLYYPASSATSQKPKPMSLMFYFI